MLFDTSTEKFIINNLRAADFAERLSVLVDGERRGLISDNPAPFFGTIHRNSFKLWTNTVLKSEITGFYGEFHERDQYLTVYIEYAMSFQKSFHAALFVMIPLAMAFITFFSIEDVATRIGTTFFFLLFLMAVVMVLYVTTKKTRARISGRIRTIFTDKKIENLNE